MQSEEIKSKLVKTIQSKYVVDNIMDLDQYKQLLSGMMKDPERRKQYQEASMAHYGVPHPHMAREIQAKTVETTMQRYGVPYYVMLPEYKSAQASNQISLANRTVANRLTEAGVETEFEFPLETKLYDIRLKNKNVVIEVDPSYTHSNLPNHWSEGLPRTYHIDETNIAERNGYRCIHIFDWDDVSKIVDLLKPKQRIYARKCKIIKPDTETARQFIENYHLQGNARGAKYAYGLEYNGALVSVMTFGKPRYNSNYQWELLRLCTHPDHEIIGGASRMFKQFIQEVNPESILSYCDKAKFQGHVYTKLGFMLHHSSEPAKVWSKGNQYITDNLLRQRGYDQIFRTSFGKGTSNEQLMIQSGWRSVYDCGQMVFEWKR